MGIKKNLEKLRNSIPKEITLVAVSKTKPISDILVAYESGQRIFGENKVQELEMKHTKLPSDIEWHMIGHLQSNKVKYIAPFISLIHAVDSLKLLKEINRRAKQNNRIINCLLQVHIASERTKFGFEINEINEILDESNKLENICIKGLMGMATFTEEKSQLNSEFTKINNLFKKIKNKKISTLSIGMSGDYELAINNGSTMIRIGSTIFGNRN
ncbi:YggS family pyridoxal phosphate-dependent enzyme [Flavobacteriales bacterium]|jgi:pyridoxal phosphate enzyme (YggS family)|nr:YggS family pyridoxal phosphate-dependent enzyme [Flavobacteriales bacterium]MDA7578623.1 YggS family pyridoxal phosphate-dependent enzyme [Flavobacteriales bacterium]MDC0909225.1 YggS family pyridoxal phosphate-dependent enzyme [Flavobacteriales bacterium]MDG1284157.1 YggS family pyridoxal phosphate-dependent enzyme [Flavobacteriales bacterium]